MGGQVESSCGLRSVPGLGPQVKCFPSGVEKNNLYQNSLPLTPTQGRKRSVLLICHLLLLIAWVSTDKCTQSTQSWDAEALEVGEVPPPTPPQIFSASLPTGFHPVTAKSTPHPHTPHSQAFTILSRRGTNNLFVI